MSDQIRLPGVRPAADAKPDPFEPRGPAEDAAPDDEKEPLIKLERLLETLKKPPPPARKAPAAARTGGKAAKPPYVQPPRPSIEKQDNPARTAAVGAQPPRPVKTEAYVLKGPYDEEPRRRFRRWRWRASALALASAALVGAVFAFKGDLQILPKTLRFIAAGDDRSQARPSSDEPVGAARPGVPLMQSSAASTDVAQPSDAKVSPPAAGPPATPAQPEADLFSATRAATIDKPVAPAAAAASPVAAARAAALPLEFSISRFGSGPYGLAAVGRDAD